MYGPGSSAIHVVDVVGNTAVFPLGGARYDGAGEVELVERHDDVLEMVGVCAENVLIFQCAPVGHPPGVSGVEHTACLSANEFVDEEEGWEVVEFELGDIGVVVGGIDGGEGGWVGLDLEIDKQDLLVYHVTNFARQA